MLMYSLSAQEADLALCRCEDGVETALQYAKMWCRYAKDLLAWMEKRISLGKSTCNSVEVLYSVQIVVICLVVSAMSGLHTKAEINVALEN